MPILHMETTLVRSTGQALLETAVSTEQQANTLQQSLQTLAAAWQGPSHDLFAQEAQLLVSQLGRLANEGEALNGRLLREVAEWERVDSQLGGSGAGGIGSGPITGEPTMPVGGDEPATRPEPAWQFEPDELIRYDPDYDHAALGSAMSGLQALLRNSDQPNYEQQLAEILQRLAQESGVSYDEMAAQFEHFMTLRQDSWDDSLSMDSHWGSIEQLRFGKVVGDSLGIHPIFGAMLSPTGGLIGPGDSESIHEALYIENGVISFHGAAHDAAGYLYKYHDGLGPGYDYVGDLPWLTELFGDSLVEKNPLIGQVEGIAFWGTLLGVSKERLAETIASLLIEQVEWTTPLPDSIGDWLRARL